MDTFTHNVTATDVLMTSTRERSSKETIYLIWIEDDVLVTVMEVDGPYELYFNFYTATVFKQKVLLRNLIKYPVLITISNNLMLSETEEIDDLETFLTLNERDFIRLQLTTKMIKWIEKLQLEYKKNDYLEHESEEWIQENLCMSESHISDIETINQNWSVDNPYSGINLEEINNIDRIFERTQEGSAIMEALKENYRPKETFIKRINSLLCECLKSLHGCRPNNFYKIQIAISLVKSYPALASPTDVPQALWFHAHARGLNHHAGRIHYHMEYLARKSEDRVIKRRRIEEYPPSSDVSFIPMNENTSDDCIQQAMLELKFIVPSQQNKNRIIELWNISFQNRQQSRELKHSFECIDDFPVLTAYNGELITLDFLKIRPQATSFSEKWETVQERILSQYNQLFCELNHGRRRVTK
ncbi:uncharacterized protein LOC131427042 [Malaya genurostris]|uniref:uncharacterized protein LOC131427042 n=1 Tax=Malaya genurostris TaxID=325434 RepID=UPI0026F3FE82|nr:uncharacterized protein LOC131427042 [Malaya genurostris]